MKRLLLLSALCASTGALLAQTTDATVIDRAGQPARPPALPATDGPSVSDVAAETESDDAGVQRLAEPRKLPFKLTASADLQVYFTDNVQLAPDGAAAANSDATVVGHTLSLRLTGNPITLGEGLLIPGAGFTYQAFRHGYGSDDVTRNDLDFDAYSLPINVTYRFGEGWEATAGLTTSAVYRIHGAGDYKRIIASYTPALSIRKLVPINQEQLLVVSAGLSQSFTKTTRDSVLLPALSFRDDRNDKTDYSLDATYYILKGDWIFTPYARVGYGDYNHYQEAAFTPVKREDLTASLGLVVTYNINNWSSARVFANYDRRDSDPTGPFDYSYKAGTIGLGASLNLSY